MELRVSRDVLDKEVSRVLVGTQEKRENLEKLDLMALMEKTVKAEWQDPQERVETLAREVPKVPKDKQET